MAFVAFIAALVDVSTFPDKLTESTLLVKFILTFISVAVRSINFFTPATLAVLHSILEISDIIAPVLPFILAESIWFTELILASVNIAIGKDVCSLAVLETVAPLAFISVSILPFVNAISIGFGRSPLAYVGITKNAFPDALAFFESSSPFALIHFSISPGVKAFAMGLVAHEFSFVFVTVRIAFHSPPIARVALPLAFVDPCFPVDHHSHARSLAFHKLAPIASIIVFFHTEVFCLSQKLVVKHRTLHSVLFCDGGGLPHFRIYRLALF
jgi:hypothetical protein